MNAVCFADPAPDAVYGAANEPHKALAFGASFLIAVKMYGALKGEVVVLFSRRFKSILNANSEILRERL